MRCAFNQACTASALALHWPAKAPRDFAVITERKERDPYRPHVLSDCQSNDIDHLVHIDYNSWIVTHLLHWYLDKLSLPPNAFSETSSAAACQRMCFFELVCTEKLQTIGRRGKQKRHENRVFVVELPTLRSDRSAVLRNQLDSLFVQPRVRACVLPDANGAIHEMRQSLASVRLVIGDAQSRSLRPIDHESVLPDLAFLRESLSTAAQMLRPLADLVLDYAIDVEERLSQVRWLCVIVFLRFACSSQTRLCRTRDDQFAVLDPTSARVIGTPQRFPALAVRLLRSINCADLMPAFVRVC